jgi:hypothetical protein
MVEEDLPPFVASSSCVEMPFLKSWFKGGRLPRMERDVFPEDLIKAFIMENKEKKAIMIASPFEYLVRLTVYFEVRNSTPISSGWPAALGMTSQE